MLIRPTPQPTLLPAALIAPLVVLDTNVVLDWLLFDGLEGRAVGAAVGAGQLRWIGTAAMRAELAHVLARGVLDRWQPDLAALWTHWECHCNERPAPTPSSLAARFHCTDADDQMFIDFAVASGPCLLLSRDRAVLKLARRLRAATVEVLTPGAWLARSPPTD